MDKGTWDAADHCPCPSTPIFVEQTSHIPLCERGEGPIQPHSTKRASPTALHILNNSSVICHTHLLHLPSPYSTCHCVHWEFRGQCRDQGLGSSTRGPVFLPSSVFYQLNGVAPHHCALCYPYPNMENTAAPSLWGCKKSTGVTRPRHLGSINPPFSSYLILPISLTSLDTPPAQRLCFIHLRSHGVQNKK